MVTITVGYVAGIIAAAIFVSRIWAPMVITFILSGILKDKNSAATWTVASRAFERTHWPDVLRSDSVKNHGVRTSVVFLTNFVSLMALLIAIAGIVTPLGIYQTLAPAHSTETPFTYIHDDSPFGIGTPGRSNLGFNRVCSTDDFGETAYSRPVPCPFSDTVDIVSVDANGSNSSFPYGYDVSIPQILLDTYSSGTGNGTTVSNFFDIQWRQYTAAIDPTHNYNNGSSYLVGVYRGMKILALDNTTEAVEGLIVDTVRGGIGFRNHTVPPGYEFGVSWQEDLLFIEPETVCVDTNTTIDYTIGPFTTVTNSSYPIIKLFLTDRGGFVNMNRTFPEANLSNPQENPDLWTRAYKSAWLTNVYTALWYNITDTGNETSGRKAFSYINSFMNKSIPLVNLDSEGGDEGFYDTLFMDASFNYHLNIPSGGPGNSSDPAAGGLPNPFGITQNNFTGIGPVCAGITDGDYANITNVYVRCGLMSGVPQRQDNGSGLIFEPGSSWSQPLYSCAGAVKATIKTVSFVFNGTYELPNLKITSVQPKSYANTSDMPLWGMENTGNEYIISGLSMIWGLVSHKYENNPNVSTIQKESLYLPGYYVGESGNPFSTLSPIESQNLPASDFYHSAMEAAYLIAPAGQTLSPIDYTGRSSIAMWATWQALSKNPTSAALIPNLVFTDYAAAAVVGTKGVLGPGNAATQNLVPISVIPTVSKIKYHWPFAIPALIVALGLLLFTALATFSMLLRRHTISRLRVHLNQLSPGRIFTTFLFPDPETKSLDAEEWSRRFGKQMVDLSGEHQPDADNGTVPEKPSAVIDSKAVSDAHNGEGEGFLGGNGHVDDGDAGR